MLTTEVGEFTNVFLQGKPKLVPATVALVNIEGLVFIEDHRHILRIHRATEELDAVV